MTVSYVALLKHKLTHETVWVKAEVPYQEFKEYLEECWKNYAFTIIPVDESMIPTVD